MRRREFITSLSGAVLLWPLGTDAQQAGTRRIGILHSATEDAPRTQRFLSAFREALMQLDWTEGKNLQIEYRFGHDDALTRLPAMASELLDLQPSVVVTVSAPASLAMKRLTGRIPIVFVSVGDPLGAGLVRNLARPDGNVTGFAVSVATSLSGKRLELLREISPGFSRAILMFNPDTSTYRGTVPLNDFLEGAARLTVNSSVAEVRSQAQIEEAIAALGREPKGGLLVGQDTFMVANSKLIIASVAKHGVPAVFPFGFFVREGGLLSYGVDPLDSFRRAAGYVSRILNGEKPADLPVQQPTRFELVINMKTARALGITVPQTLLARADEVIE
jgi:putative ABC transport system substrate-binding protein